MKYFNNQRHQEEQCSFIGSTINPPKDMKFEHARIEALEKENNKLRTLQEFVAEEHPSIFAKWYDKYENKECSHSSE